MTETNQDQATQLAQLEQLYAQGLLSEPNCRAALAGLGIDPAAVFDQSGQRSMQRMIGLGANIGPGLKTPG